MFWEDGRESDEEMINQGMAICRGRRWGKIWKGRKKLCIRNKAFDILRAFPPERGRGSGEERLETMGQ